MWIAGVRKVKGSLPTHQIPFKYFFLKKKLTSSEDLKHRRESFWNKVKNKFHTLEQKRKKTFRSTMEKKMKLGMKKIINYENNVRNNVSLEKYTTKQTKIIQI